MIHNSIGLFQSENGTRSYRQPLNNYSHVREHNMLKAIIRHSGKPLVNRVMMNLGLKLNPHTRRIQQFDVIFATRRKVDAIDVVGKYLGRVKSLL